jgi:hypothetical protein
MGSVSEGFPRVLLNDGQRYAHGAGLSQWQTEKPFSTLTQMGTAEQVLLLSTGWTLPTEQSSHGPSVTYFVNAM